MTSSPEFLLYAYRLQGHLRGLARWQFDLLKAEMRAPELTDAFRRQVDGLPGSRYIVFARSEYGREYPEKSVAASIPSEVIVTPLSSFEELVVAFST